MTPLRACLLAWHCPDRRLGWPARAGRDASPPHPRASAFSNEPANPAAVPARIGQAARGASVRPPSPGSCRVPPASRRGPRRPGRRGFAPSPKGGWAAGGLQGAKGAQSPRCAAGRGEEPHKSASGRRMGSFMPGKGLSHPGQGDEGTRVATASLGTDSLAPTGALSIALWVLGDGPPARLAPPLAHAPDLARPSPCQRPGMLGARDR